MVQILKMIKLSKKTKKQKNKNMEKNWEQVFSTDQLYQAELIKQLLDNNSIPSVIINKKDSSYQAFGNSEVYVNLNDKEKALQIIKSSEIE